MQASDDSDGLDPAAARDSLEFAEYLRMVHARADSPSYRTMEKKNSVLGHTAMSQVLNGRLPRKAFLLAFLEVCGVPESEFARWITAWERLAPLYRRRSPHSELVQAANINSADGDEAQLAAQTVKTAQEDARVLLQEASTQAAEILEKARRDAEVEAAFIVNTARDEARQVLESATLTVHVRENQRPPIAPRGMAGHNRTTSHRPRVGRRRIHELAKEFGVTSKEVLTKLEELGEFVKSASSTLEEPIARRLRDAYSAYTGNVKWFDAEKGYGFITRDDDSSDVFVHHTGIAGSRLKPLKEGQTVSFQITHTPKGPRAMNVYVRT